MPDIFELFKENEAKLHERPGEKTWQKLEQRLERQRKKRQRRIRFMQLAAVAMAIFLLLLAAAAIFYFTGKK